MNCTSESRFDWDSAIMARARVYWSPHSKRLILDTDLRSGSEREELNAVPASICDSTFEKRSS